MGNWYDKPDEMLITGALLGFIGGAFIGSLYGPEGANRFDYFNNNS